MSNLTVHVEDLTLLPQLWDNIDVIEKEIEKKIGEKKMSKTTVEEKTEKITVQKGLQIRSFDGEFEASTGKKIPMKYRRIVFPWSRTGKDSAGSEVTGAVPSLTEVMTFLQKEGISTEIVLKGESPDTMSVVQLLVDGWNRFEQQQQRAKAENTPEIVKGKTAVFYAKAMGISVTEAHKQLFGE